MIREDFLQQNAFADVDSYSSYDRQMKLLSLILHYETLCRDAIGKGAVAANLFTIPAREKIGRAKSVSAETYAEEYAKIDADMVTEIEAVIAQGGEF